MNELLDELAAQMPAPPPPGAVTVRQLMAKRGCSEPVARRFLDEQAEAGTLVKQQWGNTCYYWRE